MSVAATALDVVVDRNVTVIALGPAYKSIDERAIEERLRTALLAAVDRADPPLVVIDLAHVTFFGSSFIELLFRLWNRVQSKPSGALVICGVTSYCNEVLTVAHLDTLWRLYETRDDAVLALSGGAG